MRWGASRSVSAMSIDVRVFDLAIYGSHDVDSRSIEHFEAWPRSVQVLQGGPSHLTFRFRHGQHAFACRCFRGLFSGRGSDSDVIVDTGFLN